MFLKHLIAKKFIVLGIPGKTFPCPAWHLSLTGKPFSGKASGS